MSMTARLGFALAMTAATITPLAVLFMLPAWLSLGCLVLGVALMATTRLGRQTWSVARVGIATIPQRLGATAVVAVSIAGVVGVLVALLAMRAGFEATLKQTGTDDTAIVMQTGAQSEGGSTISHDTIAVISHAAQVLQDAQGRPIASAELVVVTSLRKKSVGKHGNVTIRGVGESVWNLRPHVEITSGRKFETGLNELLVGRGVHMHFAGMGPGSTLTLNGQPWTIVGFFDSGDAYDSEIWGDTDVIGSAFRRGNGKTSLTVRLTEASALDSFKAALAGDVRLKVEAQTTREYYARQSEGLTRTARILGITVGAIMAIGAVFGALNSMYSAVDVRTREIATLRALGFHPVTVIVSVLLETMLLAALGGATGAAIAWAIFDGFTASTLGTNGLVMFAFDVSPALLWSGLQWALAIGFIGGLFPAVRAARMPITIGLREL